MSVNIQPFEDILQAVKQYAIDHYNDGGWDVIVECYDDIALTRLLVDDAGYSPETAEEAIEAVKPYVTIWAERQADAENSAF